MCNLIKWMLIVMSIMTSSLCLEAKVFSFDTTDFITHRDSIKNGIHYYTNGNGFSYNSDEDYFRLTDSVEYSASRIFHKEMLDLKTSWVLNYKVRVSNGRQTKK